MLNEKILDEVLPVPELAELKDQTVEQLKEEGFAVTNFSAGGVFYHLMLIALQVRIELVQLLRMVLGICLCTLRLMCGWSLRQQIFPSGAKPQLRLRAR